MAVEAGPRAALRLAVFTSEGCPLCAQVAPAVAHVAADPLLAVRIFDEHADAPCGAQAGVPGSPYAVALSVEGWRWRRARSTDSASWKACSRRRAFASGGRACRLSARGTQTRAASMTGTEAPTSTASTAVPTRRGEAGRFADAVLRSSSRRGFLEWAGTAIIALAGARTVARGVLPDEADAYTNFCGHTYTTGNCPHPTGLPRVDRHDLPLRASDGHPVDDLGRPINAQGYPVDAHGQVLREPDGEPLAPAPRSQVCPAAGKAHGLEPAAPTARGIAAAAGACAG